MLATWRKCEKNLFILSQDKASSLPKQKILCINAFKLQENLYLVLEWFLPLFKNYQGCRTQPNVQHLMVVNSI